MRTATLKLLSCLCCALLLYAQDGSIEPIKPTAPFIIRPYLARDVPPIRLADSPRLAALMRGGALYLTVQDAIALALENNIDLEVARYNPIISAWNLKRSEAGGALPGVPSGASQAGTVASGQGIAGSQAAAGLSGGGGVGGGTNTSNATISQVGPVTQNLDPSLQEASTFSHVSSPQANPTQTLSTVLISNTRVHNVSWQQGFLTGGGYTLSYTDHYLNESAIGDLLNPSSAPSLSLSFQHNLLQGLGIAVNARTINVNKIALNTSDLNFRTQVTSVVVNVLNSYFAVVSDEEDIKARQAAVDAAQQFFGETKRREELGGASGLDITTAESQLAATQRDLVVSESDLRQDQVQLKNQLSRRGVLEPVLASVRLVLLDRIVIPSTDDLPPLDEMVQQTLMNRPDIAAARANIQTSEVSSIGTTNGVRPSVQAIGGFTNSGLAGTAQKTPFGEPDPFVVGGIGTALGQIFRRNYPTERIGAFAQVRIHNRQALADQGIDQLQLRQTELTTQKTLNQVQVDVSNYAVALRQARVRYQSAMENRLLNEQLYEAEQRKLVLGASTPYNVVQQQRDLIGAQATEVSALATYQAAKIALDETLGRTLEVNHVSIGEAKSGVVDRASVLPATP